MLHLHNPVFHQKCFIKKVSIIGTDSSRLCHFIAQLCTHLWILNTKIQRFSLYTFDHTSYNKKQHQLGTFLSYQSAVLTIELNQEVPSLWLQNLFYFNNINTYFYNEGINQLGHLQCPKSVNLFGMIHIRKTKSTLIRKWENKHLIYSTSSIL